MKGGKIVDENPSIRDGKIIEKNQSKNGIEEKIRVKRARMRYRDRMCYHCHKRVYIQYT